MAKYKDKYCNVCGNIFTPTSPNQKYCNNCKEEGKKIVSRSRDRKRSRKKEGYKEYTRHCEICGKEFTTYYSKKKYCGSEECEKIRIKRKNANFQKSRCKSSERSRYKDYYNRNSKLCKYKKALKYRELNPNAKPYVPGRVYKHNIDEVREYVSKFGYKLLSNKYRNNKSKIKLLCPNGHEWETTFHNFRNNGGKKGNRCLYCYLENNYTSEPEQKLLDFFVENYPDLKIIHNDRKQISPLEIDLYFPDHKLGIEVCGLYWHSEISGGKKRSYHYDKMMKCYENNIRLITIFEDEIRDKFDIVMSRVLQSLEITQNKIYARKCEVRKIDKKVANAFFEKYHIQGHSQLIESWGLFYNYELIQACGIGRIIRKHVSNKDVIELKRFCSKNGFSVVGGFSKLFKHIVDYCKNNNYEFIKSYCDMRYANIFNTVYEKVGFILDDFTKYTPHYFRNGIRYRNFSLRKTPEERKTGKTEFELRCEQGYDRIWDCGHRTYLYRISEK